MHNDNDNVIVMQGTCGVETGGAAVVLVDLVAVCAPLRYNAIVLVHPAMVSSPPRTT